MIATLQPVRLATVLLSLLFATSGQAAATDRRLPDPRMLGQWVLDAEHSDDAMKLLEAPHDRHRGPPPVDATAGGPSRGDQPGPGGDDPRGPRGFSGVPALDRELTRGRSLALGIDADRITLVYAGERHRTVHDPNHGERIVSASGGSEDGEFGYSIAYRDGTTLVIETPGGPGGTVFERYALSPDGTTLQLTLTTLAHGERPAPMVQRRFVRPPGAAAPSRVDAGFASHDDAR